MRFERIAYTRHAHGRMRRRRISRGEVQRILNEPEITYPSKDSLDRMVDVLIITVLDFGSDG